MNETVDDVLLEENKNENYYYDEKYMIMIIRLHKIRIYKCLSIPLQDSNLLHELDFGDIEKVQ